ncbi:MAG: hypothetical protein WB767_16300 [Nocardioides sp.]
MSDSRDHRAQEESEVAVFGAYRRSREAASEPCVRGNDLGSSRGQVVCRDGTGWSERVAQCSRVLRVQSLPVPQLGAQSRKGASLGLHDTRGSADGGSRLSDQRWVGPVLQWGRGIEIG